MTKYWYLKKAFPADYHRCDFDKKFYGTVDGSGYWDLKDSRTDESVKWGKEVTKQIAMDACTIAWERKTER